MLICRIRISIFEFISTDNPIGAIVFENASVNCA